jgi:hypothetical protein
VPPGPECLRQEGGPISACCPCVPLSVRSERRGYVQKEIRQALDVAEEYPEGRIYIIPVRLEDCPVPDRLIQWQWVDLYSKDGYRRLFTSLSMVAKALPDRSADTQD